MLKDYFKRITLFTVLAFLSFVALIITLITHQPEEMKYPLLYRTAIAIGLFVMIDVLLKQVLKLATLWIWIIQLFLLLAAIYIWIVS